MLNTVKKYLKDEKGFTLIELIVVIAIIGILIAVAVPKLSGFTGLAKESNDKQLAKMMANNVGALIALGKIVPDADGGSLIVTKNGAGLSYALTGGVEYFEADGAVTASEGVVGQVAGAKLTAEIGKLLDSNATITTVPGYIRVTISGSGDVKGEFVATAYTASAA